MKFPDVNPPPPQSGVVPCLYCGEALDVGRALEQIIAFRARDGRLRAVKATGRWACALCVGRLEAGEHPLAG